MSVLFVQSLYSIRKHAKSLPKTEKKVKNDPDTILARNFFKNIDDNGSIIKWTCPELEERFDQPELNHRDDEYADD